MVRRTEEGPASGGDPNLADDALKSGWEQTVADMRAMAEDRQTKGFETLTLASGDTTPLAPGQGDDRLGFSHLIPGDKVEAFEEFYEGGDYDETGVYQTTDGGHAFIVTEHIDYEDEAIIYIAGAFMLADVAATVRAATERGELYTYVRQLDQTILGTFHHDDVSAFFPDPDRYLAYEHGR